MAAKASSERMIKPFSGEGDVRAWLTKVELVARLTDIKEVASLIPLYLEGGALAVYLEMPDKERSNLETLKKGLTQAFSDSQFVAYSKLRASKWTGEPVDVFANELRKLGRESGLTGTGLEQIVKLAFVTGLPDGVSVELQQVQGVEDLNVSDLLGRARVLVGNQTTGTVAAPAVGSTTGAQRKGTTLSCYGCGGPHMVRVCPGRKRVELKCFKCEGPHLVKFCPELTQTKQQQAALCANGDPVQMVASGVKDVPVILAEVNGNQVRALVDTGCTNSMVTQRVAGRVHGQKEMVAFDGRRVRCKGTSVAQVKVGDEVMQLEVTVAEQLVGGVDFVLGMDVISMLGGVRVQKHTVCFGDTLCAAAVTSAPPDISDPDFEAFYDGKVWTVRYLWNERGPPVLKNTVSEYRHKLSDDQRRQYEAEVDRWVEEGILRPWKGESGGVLPLMAVVQETKGKVRPVLDFRELNESVRCHTGDDVIDVCSEKLREWRQKEGDAKMVDLRAAYLQIRVSEELWRHQLVRYKGELFCLTRLGFGLNSAPRVMSKILKTVLQKDQEIGAATSSYIDDIHVDVTKVTADRVREHLEKYGLEAKEPEELDGGSALGLKLRRSPEGKLLFFRANEIPEVGQTMTRRELFSLCGKLVGHYPRAGWLRVACSYAKRHAEGVKWGDDIGEVARERAREMVEEVRANDPVRGEWQVPQTKSGTVWCDASNLAIGVVLEINGVVVEDAAWLRKTDDHHHINVAELEAVLKGVNLCVKWGVKDITIKTDSATVKGWLGLTMSEERRVKTNGAAELLIKRRLGILKELISELGLTLTVELVKSGANRADELTRVRKRWLEQKGLNAVSTAIEEVRAMHEQHHMGVERTWYLAKKMGRGVDKDMVKRVVSQCERCQSIDPAPASHLSGEVGVRENWTRLAIDITHYGGLPYLTMVDCGPGRFMIWRQLKGETATEVCREINNVFFERGMVRELLMDNARAFRSEEMQCLLDRWGVKAYYRAAYRPGGNGIVERSHRTIKAMAERSGTSPIEAAYWYNMVPREGQREGSAPQRSIYTYEWQLGGEESMEVAEEVRSAVRVGDEVWVKPGGARCTTQWKTGRVTGVTSVNNVDIDGMPRHILDIRPIVKRVEETQGERETVQEGQSVDVDREDSANGEGDEVRSEGGRGYPLRTRTVPVRLRDYVCDQP